MQNGGKNSTTLVFVAPHPIANPPSFLFNISMDLAIYRGVMKLLISQAPSLHESWIFQKLKKDTGSACNCFSESKVLTRPSTLTLTNWYEMYVCPNYSNEIKIAGWTQKLTLSWAECVTTRAGHATTLQRQREHVFWGQNFAIHLDTEASTCFKFFCHWSSNILSHCRCREAKQLSRAQLWSQLRAQGVCFGLSFSRSMF